MSEFKHRISYTAQLADIAKANELMAWIGEPGDIRTFRELKSGAYSLASGLYTEDFIGKLATPLTEASRPAWDTENTLSLATAQAGQAALSLTIDEQEPQSEALEAKGKSGKVVTSMKGVAKGDPENPEEWAEGVTYAIGDLCGYEGTTYMCIQAHTSIVTWAPPNVPALFVVIPKDKSIWQAGVQYAVDDEVTYEGNGLLYVCIQAHTSQVGWEPPNVPALWRPVQAQYGMVYGPFTTSGTTYWIGNRGTEWGVGFNLDDDNDADVWLTMEELAALALSAAKKRAIRNKAKSLGWPA